jgi:arabinofuranosyltransferase
MTMDKNSRTFPTLLDLILITLLIAITAGYAFSKINFSSHPHEDAAMLMRYARHLAEGHGVVWNVGESPVDGATDFLFMVILAGVFKTGVSLEKGVLGLNLLSHLLTVLLVYACLQMYFRERWVSFISAAYLALGPGIRYTEAYFGTPFFAFFAGLTFCLALGLIYDGISLRRSLLFSFSGLLLGLTRPEGVFLAVLILLSIVCKHRIKNSLRILRDFTFIFALLGGTYFFWRWNYFGYPLPNPYYIKGDGLLYFESLTASVENAVQGIYPFLILFLVSLFLSACLSLLQARAERSGSQPLWPARILASTQPSARMVYPLIPIIGFTLIWILLSNQMNYLGRFQYPVIPLVLMSWPAFVDVRLLERVSFGRISNLGGIWRTFSIAVYLVISMAVLWHPIQKYANIATYPDGRFEVAKLLQQYKDEGYTIATTEAGLLPLYSEWRAVDTWGLNDPWIAHTGQVTKHYLQDRSPEVILIHDYPQVPLEERTGHPWYQMVDVLIDYAQENEYILAAVYGTNPGNVHTYYVRPGFQDSVEIVAHIRNVAYVWYRNGKICKNFTGTGLAGTD